MYLYCNLEGLPELTTWVTYSWLDSGGVGDIFCLSDL